MGSTEASLTHVAQKAWFLPPAIARSYALRRRRRRGQRACCSARRSAGAGEDRGTTIFARRARRRIERPRTHFSMAAWASFATTKTTAVCSSGACAPQSRSLSANCSPLTRKCRAGATTTRTHSISRKPMSSIDPIPARAFAHACDSARSIRRCRSRIARRVGKRHTRSRLPPSAPGSARRFAPSASKDRSTGSARAPATSSIFSSRVRCSAGTIPRA